MDNNQETERDTIAWHRVGLVVTAVLIGLALYISDTRPAAYFFLGYALLGTVAMFLFKSWRSSTEVEKVQKNHWKRMILNVPRGIIRFLLGFLAYSIVLGIGLIPIFFTSNESYHQHEQLWNIYIFFLLGISFVTLLWAVGFIKAIRQIFADLKEVREASKKTKQRRAEEQNKST